VRDPTTLWERPRPRQPPRMISAMLGIRENRFVEDTEALVAPKCAPTHGR